MVYSLISFHCRIGTVEVVVSKDGIVSKSSALYTKRTFTTGLNFTLHIMSSVIITKWTKLHLMIKSDTDLLIQKGSTVSLVFLGKCSIVSVFMNSNTI